MRLARRPTWGTAARLSIVWRVLALMLLLAFHGLPVVRADDHADAATDDAVARAEGTAAAADAVDVNVARLDVAFRFDAEDLLTLTDAGLLPAPRGSVAARWVALDGWAVVLFDGLDEASASRLCVGTSAIDPSTGLIGHVTYDAIRDAGCEGAPGGPLPLASRWA